MGLLFVTAHWHSLAKLRMHTDLTLDIMDTVTTSLGEKLRKFKDMTCSAFVTHELEREFNARVRRQAKKAVANNTKSTGGSVKGKNQLGQQSTAGIESEAHAREQVKSPRLKTFNLNTYKFHALGDYTATIRRYGTTDSYSTEPVSSFKVAGRGTANSLSVVGRTGAPNPQSEVYPHKSQKFSSTDSTDRATADSYPSYPRTIQKGWKDCTRGSAQQP
jgi:hypothetical protein